MLLHKHPHTAPQGRGVSLVTDLNYTELTPPQLTCPGSHQATPFLPPHRPGGLYLIQLQGLPILGPADEEQWGVGADRAPDHPPHAYGQGGLRRHRCHLRWVWWGKQWQVVGQELGLAQGEGAGLGREPGEAYRAQ